MLEASAQEISERGLEKAIEFAQKEIQLLTGFFQHISNSLEIKRRGRGIKKEEITDDSQLAKTTDYHLGQILLTKNIP
jgi:hypothetical protein